MSWSREAPMSQLTSPWDWRTTGLRPAVASEGGLGTRRRLDRQSPGVGVGLWEAQGWGGDQRRALGSLFW